MIQRTHTYYDIAAVVFSLSIGYMYTQFDFRQWAVQNGHRAVLVGKGEWSDLTIHLDENAGGALLELVTLPLSVERMHSILTKLKREFPIEYQTSTADSYSHIVKWLGDNFDHGWSPETDEDTMAFEYILCGLSLQNTLAGLFWNNMPQVLSYTIFRNRLALFSFLYSLTHAHTQILSTRTHNVRARLTYATPMLFANRNRASQITTSYTVEEMRFCTHTPVKELYSLLGKPRNDNAMKSYLMSFLYTRGGKGTSILVKHFAEQINGDAASPPPGFPKEGMDKVVPEFGLHTKANKPVQLMRRGGQTVRPSSSLRPCSPLSLSRSLSLSLSQIRRI